MNNPAAMFRHVMEAVFNPFNIGLAVFIFLVVWLCLYGDSRMIRVGLFTLLIGVLLLSTGWLPHFITDRMRRHYAVVNTVNPEIHWIVIFGGGQLVHVNAPVNYLLNKTTTQRLLEGLRLYRQLAESKLILSGGGEADETESEAAHMATLATWFAIPSRDLVLESTSINTADEAVAIKQWVHQAPFYLVTSAIHMPRAMALCQKQGLNPVPAPSDYPYQEGANWRKNWVPHPVNLLNITVAWHEILGWAWGVIRGKI